MNENPSAGIQVPLPQGQGDPSQHYQATKDAEHIKLLSIFHYVFAGLAAVATLWPLIYVGMGLFMVSISGSPSPSAAPGGPGVAVPPATAPASPAPGSSSGSGPALAPPAPSASPTASGGFSSSSSSSSMAEAKMMGWMFFGIGVLMCLAFLAAALLNFLSARFLSARKNRIFILIVSGLNTISFPLGTGLGVFTFIVLLRPSVEHLFSGQTEAVGVAS